MASLLAVAACSSPSRPSVPPPVFSPNGELLSAGGRGAPPCQEVMSEWWEKLAVDKGGSLVLERAAFFADAEAQFRAMDLDHDGFITPSELSEFRAGAEEAPPDRTPPPGVAGRPQEQAPTPYPRGSRRMGQDESYIQPRGPRTAMPADVEDPVMSADKSLSFKVSYDDYMAQAKEIYAELDKARDGRITKEAAVARCTKKR